MTLNPSSSSEPRFYAASLADYNNGILHGRWIRATSEVRNMAIEIHAMLQQSPTARALKQPSEEWAIHDFVGFGEARLTEHTTLQTVADLVAQRQMEPSAAQDITPVGAEGLEPPTNAL